MPGPGPSEPGRRSSEAQLFKRDEVLAGLPARRASGLLYAIERRTATLAARARQAMAYYQTERSAEESESSFLAALSSGRSERKRPSVQNLERYAPEWADLVPADAGSRAALARLIGQAYRLPRDRAPRIRDALGLDTSDVATAYARIHGEAIDAIWTDDPTASERLRWRRSMASARLESLPPFWMAFALTLTEAVGVGILVVPVALAGIGPIPGLFLLIVLGIANLITVGALVEAITRNGSMRYGTAYFGRLVSDLLGRIASVGMGVGLLALNLVTLLAFYLAFGTTLANATGIWVGAWVVLIFAVNLLFLYRESIDATVASAILIGIVNIALIVVLVLLAMPYVSIEHLGYAEIPLLGDSDIDSSVLALVFGVVLMAYFGHTSAANASKAVLRVDPSGRGLLWGNIAALGAVIALYCVTVVVFLGAVGAEPLIGFSGTVLTPLAALVGPVVDVVGSVYVTLAIGLGSIYVALGLYNQVREVLPRRHHNDDGASGGPLLSRHWAQRSLALVPTIMVFVAVEALILTDSASVTEPLGIVGTLAVPLVGGIFPMLLIAAARRRGELVPDRVVRFLGRTSVVVVVSSLFVAAVFAHALFIWQDPIARLVAFLVGIAVVLLIARLFAVRAFRPRTVVELRRLDHHGHQQLESVVSHGRSMLKEVLQASRDSVQLELPEPVERDLMVWAHEVTAEGDSEPLAGSVHIGLAGGGTVDRDLDHGRAEILLDDDAHGVLVDVAIVGLEGRSGEKP